MEPDITPPTEPIDTRTSPEALKKASEGLHDEGVDILQDSGISEENEFTSTEIAPELKPPAVALQSTVIPPALTKTTAGIIASLQEIPRSNIPRPEPISRPVPTPRPVSIPQPAPIPRPEVVPTQFQKPQSTPAQEKPVPTRENPAQSLQSEMDTLVSKTEQPAQVAPAFNDPSIKQLRTFKSDAEEAVRYKNISVVDIALAEQRKKEKDRATASAMLAASTHIDYVEPQKSHAGIYIVTVIVIICALGGGWYYWFSTSQTPEVKKTSSVVIKTIIPYTKVSNITLAEGSDPFTLIGSKLLQSNAGLGNIYALIPVDDPSATSVAKIETLFKNTSVPNRLFRSLSQQYMVGTYTYDIQSPFIILKNTFFQNAFAGMLEWEKSLREDFLPLIQVSYRNETSTGIRGDTFEDSIVSNIDVRVLKNADGEAILMYAFADKDTVVITTSQNALKFILDKLLTVRTIQ